VIRDTTPPADNAVKNITQRELGRSGLQVSPLCLGGNVFGWTVDRKTSFDLLDAWLDAGMNFIDTADSYSRWVPGNAGGESEQAIGDWLTASGKRHQVVLATKVGSDMGQGRKDLSARYIERAIDASLRRLRTDYIDLYQSHWDDPSTPLEETLTAYSRLIAAGKVRAIGASNLEPDRLKEALQVSAAKGLPRYESVQPHYNLCERDVYEGELQQLCVSHQLGVITYYSLAGGFLTGKYREQSDASLRARGEHVRQYLNPMGIAILNALDAVATEHGATPAQVALAWLSSRPAVVAPIVSASTLQQLAELIASAHLQLSDAAIAALNQASRQT
jgi:aryl-alcohol dehydrogenase-like predicted oxidoreductase